MTGAEAARERPTPAEIRRWLLAKLQEELESATPVDARRPLTDYGLESQVAIGVTGDLEDWLDLELDPTIFFDYPSIEELADHLDEELGSGD